MKIKRLKKSQVGCERGVKGEIKDEISRDKYGSRLLYKWWDGRLFKKKTK